ncbi:uncharacterized protein FA14DRAFT_188110 [Meira miltonrushii]|uniref:Uncharacterized protein n=1 Tax=Meira miltonrushii TaxID=1280837 RepID=A0A316VLW5_9BASI|nr:uncharacterized protein FA14DRAFT_188110 [Meira miltonrushii]PWN38078.1 hypothetical protein FA14DRAFT_188110 [Meira miltonrushii]
MFQKAGSRSWSDLIHTSRHRQGPLPQYKPHLKSFTQWQDTLSQFHKQRRVVWRDGDILWQRMMRYAYTVWSHCLRIAYAAFVQISIMARRYAENATGFQILIGVGIGGLVFIVSLLLIVRSQQNKRAIKALHLREKEALQDEEYDSDDFDFEDDLEEEEKASSLPPHLRKMLIASRQNRRSSSKDSALSRPRPSSLIRIVSSDPQSQLSENAMQMDLHARPGHSPVPNSRKRKESGRLLHGNEQSSSSSNASSPRLVHTAGRSAKQRRSTSRNSDHESKRPTRLDSLTRQGKSSQNNDEIGSQSPNSLKSFASAQTDMDSLWIGSPAETSNKLASILRREPQYYASLPQTPLAVDQHILDTRSPYGFWSVEPNSEFANSDTFHTLPPTSTLSPGRLPPGAGRGPTSPVGGGLGAGPRLGTLSPEQAQALWPEKRQKMVKLREPDWSPYIEVHERARERLDKMAEMSAIRSTSPFLVSGSSISEEGSGSGNGSNTGDEDDEFWFERFTKSTAASGRDWDWRKRRARQRATARMATIGGNSVSAVDANGMPMQTLNGVSAQLISDLQLQKPLPVQPGDSAVYLSENGQPRRQSPNSLPVPLRTASAPLLSTVSTENDRQDNVKAVENGSHGRNGQSPPSAYEQGRLIASGQNWPRFQSSARTLSLGSSANSSPKLNNEAGPFEKRSRRFSDTDQADADEAVSVPGRLSSLKPKAVKKLIMRGRSSKQDLRAVAEEEQQKYNRQQSNGKHVQENGIQATGWSVSPDDHQRQTRDVRKASSMNRLNAQFTASTPALPLSSMPDPPLGNHVSPWTEQRIESQQAWSSADAYGVSAPTSFEPERNGGGASLFARPSGRMTESQNDNVLTSDLAQLYSSFYAISPSQSPTLPQQDPSQHSPGRRRPVRHETMPLLHSTNQLGFTMPSTFLHETQSGVK